MRYLNITHVTERKRTTSEQASPAESTGNIALGASPSRRLGAGIASSLLRWESSASTSHVGHRRIIALATASAVAAVTASQHIVAGLGESLNLALSILQHHTVIVINRGMRIDAGGSLHGTDAGGAA